MNKPFDMLPHSYPFLLIDKISEFEEGKRIVCLKNVTLNEEFFQGHFKNNPVMPGLLIIEAMAQTSGLLIGKDKQRIAYLSSIKDARFKKPVLPGDQLVITSSIILSLPPQYVFNVIAMVGADVVCEAELVLTMV